MGKHTTLSESQLDKFADVQAHTKSPMKAMIAAQPELILNKNYANVKGRRLVTKPDVKARIDKKLQKMASKATKRIDSLIQSDDERIATTNAWKVIEHNVGTPISRSINVNATATVEDALFE
jgi:hypothetical protein